MPPAVLATLAAADAGGAPVGSTGGAIGVQADLPGMADPPPARARLAPEALHPALWLGHQLGRHADDALPSGHPLLDAELPGGGWPRRVLSELLLPHPGVGEIRLLAPSVAAAQRQGRLVMLFDPPARLSALALGQLGIDVAQLLVIHTRTRVIPGADSLWALEQALRSGHVGLVLAWLPPRLRAERLRRLQLAAQSHDGPAFVVRELEAQQRPTAAPLRLALRAGGGDTLSVHILKRRGPPLERPLNLALPAVLSLTASERVGLPPPGTGAAEAHARARARQETALAGVAAAAEAGAVTGGSAAARHRLRAATFINLEASPRRPP